MAATMTYMHRQVRKRLDPATIVPGTTRAVVVTKNYYTPDGPSRPGAGKVAKYARGRDYHRALEQPLRQLESSIASLGDEDTIARAFVDAGPVPERELAQRAGLGWIGKNTMLIDPLHGSFFFLATVLTNLDLSIDAPFAADRCGSCRRCLDACPTAAFLEPRRLDSRRCISYLTIEHRGEIDGALHPFFDRWIFGCDICQDVCPWNVKFSSVDSDPRLALDPAHEYVQLSDLLDLSEPEFVKRFAWTAMERCGVRGLRRNASIVARNARSLSGESQPARRVELPKSENPTG
jgi:epoxyqueuosine reductase